VKVRNTSRHLRSPEAHAIALVNTRKRARTAADDIQRLGHDLPVVPYVRHFRLGRCRSRVLEPGLIRLIAIESTALTRGQLYNPGFQR